MPFDLPRLVAGCPRDYLAALIERLSPEKKDSVDWLLPDRPLATELGRAFSADGNVWPRLQEISGLATHGGKAIVRSVLYRDRTLRDRLDALDATDETAAVWLAVVSDTHFQFALSALHADRGLRKRSWRAFRAPFSADVQFNLDNRAKQRFEELVRTAIDKNRYLDRPGRLSVHHFNRVVFPGHSDSGRDQDQVTIYAEMRNVTEETFNEADQIETQRRKRIDQISVVFVRARRELDVISIGGRDFIRAVAHAFCESFSNETPKLEDLIRRPINLGSFASRPPMPLDGQNVVEAACVDELRVRSPTGWLWSLESKSRERIQEDVYDVLEQEFGDRSHFKKEGWSVESARIRLGLAPVQVGQSSKVRSVELKSDGRTNLREHVDRDRFIANALLVRWGILEPETDDED